VATSQFLSLTGFEVQLLENYCYSLINIAYLKSLDFTADFILQAISLEKLEELFRVFLETSENFSDKCNIRFSCSVLIF
jgi:hypothetical protein